MLTFALWVQLAGVRQLKLSDHDEDGLTFPGLNKLSGSIARFTVFMSSTVSSPSSSTRYSVFPIPTPCSPVPDAPKIIRFQPSIKLSEDIHVPSIAIARWMSLWTASLTDWSSRSLRKRMSPWKLPGIHFVLICGGRLREGHTISNMSNDGRFKPRFGEILFRLVHQLRELGYWNAAQFHQAIYRLPVKRNEGIITTHPSSNTLSQDETSKST